MISIIETKERRSGSVSPFLSLTVILSHQAAISDAVSDDESAASSFDFFVLWYDFINSIAGLTLPKLINKSLIGI